MLITIDTLRADALGAYGQALPTSPNIDRLAEHGVVFSQAVSSVPSTLPSHASIMTGLQPYSHGVRSNSGYVLPEQARTLAELLRDSGFRTGAEIAAAVLDRRTQLDQGFDHYRDITSSDIERKQVVVPRSNGAETRILHERTASDITQHGMQFLRKKSDRSFFLWLHYFDPHRSYTAPEPFRNRIPGSPYHAEVAYVDHEVGRVLNEIERLGLSPRTHIVITSDHGESLGEHGEATHAHFIYQSTMHVPLILAGPGIEARRVGSLVRSIDIMPTILDWLGVPAPDHMEGVSLLPLAHGSDLQLVGYGESIESRINFGTSMLRFLRDGRWKYHHKVGRELYDLEADPGELRNLASSQRDIAEGLEAKLRAQIAAAAPQLGRAEVNPDAETTAQLRALGYLSSGSRARIEDESDALELFGQDPALLVSAVEAHAHANSHIVEGRYAAAAEAYAELLDQFPDSPSIVIGLSLAYIQLDRLEEAEQLLRRAIELDPGHTGLYVDLARLLRFEQTDEADAEAEALLESSLEISPCVASVANELVDLLGNRKRYRDQIELLAAGRERCPNSIDHLNGYAWALATLPVAELRDGQRAVELARTVDAATSHTNPSALNTLAAAYAENGEFAKAIEFQHRAIGLLSSDELRSEFGETFRAQLAVLESGRPIRER